MRLRQRLRCRLRRSLLAEAARLILLFVMVRCRAETDFLERARLDLKAAQAAFAKMNNASTAVNVARAAYECADLARSNQERQHLAGLGMRVARAALTLDEDFAPAHYYLGVNLGQLARTKTLGAVKLVAEMERALIRSMKLDPGFNFAGPVRALARLYVEAPGWPVSVGNKRKSKKLMQQALELAPSYPGAHLNYIEALDKWKEGELAAERMRIYKALLPKARKEFGGEEWEDEWADWNRRWQIIEMKDK
jgi:hypothetical protein